MSTATVTVVMDTAREFRGAVHGDDADGWVDVEWPTVANADVAAFVAHARESGWPVKLRDPLVSLNRPVVLQVHGAPVLTCAACGHSPTDLDPLISTGGWRIHYSHTEDPASGFYREYEAYEPDPEYNPDDFDEYGNSYDDPDNRGDTDA